MTASWFSIVRQLTFGWVHFALALPGIYLLLGMPLIMREHGWSGADIGWFQLAGLPALFKLFLAVPVERWRGAKTPYRSWAIALCLLLTGLLWITGEQSLLGQRAWLFGLALSISVLATWADIPVNALMIMLLPEKERLQAGSIRSAALFVAAIIGGGVLLVMHNRLGWQAPFMLMGTAVLFAALGLFLLGKQQAYMNPDANKEPFAGADWHAYFKQPHVRLWNSFLLLSFPFIGTAWLYLKPLLLDWGVSIEQTAWLAGVGGGSLGALASIGCAALARKLGLNAVIPMCTGLSLFALIVLMAAMGFQSGTWALFSAVFLVAVAMGATSSLLFGMMMFFARPQCRAFDYGLQASLFVSTRFAVPVLAGVMLDAHGYHGMLMTLSLAMAGVFIFSIRSRHVLAEKANKFKIQYVNNDSGEI